MFYTHLFSPYNYVTTPKLFRLRDVGSSKQLSPKNLVAGTHPQLRVKLFSFGKILYHDQPSTRVEPSVPEPTALTPSHWKGAQGNNLYIVLSLEPSSR